MKPINSNRRSGAGCANGLSVAAMAVVVPIRNSRRLRVVVGSMPNSGAGKFPRSRWNSEPSVDGNVRSCNERGMKPIVILAGLVCAGTVIVNGADQTLHTFKKLHLDK